VYVSTINIFGNTNGKTVDEATAAMGPTARSTYDETVPRAPDRRGARRAGGR
jgi:hypothetical protein